MKIEIDNEEVSKLVCAALKADLVYVKEDIKALEGHDALHPHEEEDLKDFKKRRKAMKVLIGYYGIPE